jgi:hypothetical protein
MINANVRTYNYFTLGDTNGYGQPTISEEPTGEIKMAIYISSQTIQDNINFQDCNYIGLTTDKSVNDKMVIQCGQEKLKVLYVNPAGRFTQVFLKKL